MEHYVLGEDLPLPPARLYERLARLPGYTWDQSIELFHSTYDNWHVFGVRQSMDATLSVTAATSSGLSTSTRDSPRPESRPPFRHHWRSSLSETSSDVSSYRMEHDTTWIPVVARVSSHIVRLEREFHMIRSIVQISDPDCIHTVRPIDLFRLPPEPNDLGPILVSIFESPGPNYLKEMVAFGPAWFGFGIRGGSNDVTPGEQVPLPLFLDFAVGACECLELLHYGLRTIHGEIRGDAFHFNRATGAVRLVNTGNGARAFDNALGEGWSALSRELGAKTKLQFIAPEQTGRMPTEPDSRTDIYALGVLFWTMLTGQLAFTGNSLVDVVQNVLGKKLPPLSTKRMDVPDALSAVVQKMTQKEVAERYHTISSVKGDLRQISKLLCDGESEALKQFQIAQRDVSSFFTLPSGMFGRQEEYDKVVSIAERVYRRQQLASAKSAAQINSNGVYIGSGSSMSDGRVDSLELGEGSSDSGSFNITNSRSNSSTGPYLLGHVTTHDSSHSTESSISTQRPPLFQSKVKISADSRGAWENNDRESYTSTGASNQSHIDSLSSLMRHKTNQKLRRSGRCEVITISGVAGLGKTDLIQRVQPAIRKFGYIAIAKLDRARRVPFEAFAKILASLLRQIFSEREVNSEYHNTIRSALRPVWPTLHRVLELPEQLISPGSKESTSSPKLSVAQHLLKEGSRGEAIKRYGHSFSGNGQPSPEFFLSGGPSRNMRLMEIYVEILRTLCHQKMICVCLDALQYADDETSDLIMNVLKARIPCLLILAARKEELESADIKAVFDADSQNVTNIVLKPLSEEETGNYVAATMHQPLNPTLRPLVVIIRERSCGNPFFIRMMLDTCYRKNCIWYSWRHSSWEYDLDRVFTEFIASMYSPVLGTDFMAKRLREIPSEARAIVAWASFLGSPFSFSLVQKLLSGEFLFVSGEEDENDVTCPNATKLVQSEADVVVGLQYLIQTYVLLPGETDDEFRFAYDRFAHVSTSMRECHNIEKMHFIIALTMIKYCPDERDLYAKARHICEASRLIKIRIPNRSEHRKALREAAQLAAQSGARPTALYYFQHSFDFLQDSPWDGSLPDVDHFETAQLHIETAEMVWSQGQSKEALRLLSEFLKNVSTAPCRSKAWILKSKIHAQAGNHHDAMDSLLTSLEELGVHLREPILFDKCDAAYDQLKAYVKTVNFEAEMLRPISQDSNVIAIGNVVAEAVAVSFWGDSLTFLRMVIEMINIHLFKGGFTQIGISCSLLAMVSLSRYKDDELGSRMSDLSSLLHDYSGNSATRATILTLQHTFVSHMRSPLRSTLPALESSLEAWSGKGDPHMILLSLSAMACTRLFLGQDMSELEAFCTDIPEEVNNWMDDARVGVMPVAVKQVARAVQGKTSWRSGDVMSDDQHNSQEYMEFIDLNATNADRPRDIYWGLAMMPLYLYGHQEKAIEVGSKMMDSIDGLWSLRISYLVKFYLSLSILTRHLDNPGHGSLDSRLEDVLKYKAEVDFARSCCDANYGMWSLLLEGLLCEIREDFHASFLAYEAAIDHCEIHGWPLEEALALELQGDFLVRRGAKRPARGILKEAIAAWTGIGATGKASQLAEKHEWLLKTATTTRSHDIGCQTVDSFLISRDPAPERIVDQPQMEEERKEHWLESNGSSTEERSLDISSVGLDIIDLSSILEFSQVMSSELQIDKLLTKMIEIILESCSGSDFAVIATGSEDVGFAVAAAGDLDKGQKAFLDGLPFSKMEDKMAQQISHYTLRTREEVLVYNVLEDERFSNVSDAYQARYPLGRSVITLPIIQADNVLGVIHIEGKPNSFTQRNVVVLHLLCTQVGISLANAELFRKVRKISATNAAMIEAQKGALAQARSAEQKAKTAEAEANHNVKLKEDAAKAKSIFLANVSHDLRTPMNGVIGLSELLKGTKLDKEQDVYVESIRVCADTLLTLINDILDFSKLEAGKMKISTVPLNLKETIAEVVRALRYTHRDRGLETIEDLENVPPDLVVLGDPVRLHQIFMNLLSNSYKFTPKGSVTVRAKVSRESKGRVRLECSVADTGIGIPEEHKSRLFRPFSQADNSTARSYGGSGLGLSICKAIIEDVLGGAIWLDSTPGVGTTVTFQLSFNNAFKEAVVKAPRSHGFNQIESKEPPKPVVRDLSTTPRHQIRVCIAEDNPINQKIAVQFVRVLGLESEAFSDGRQAVDALRQRSKEGRPFHVVLMDVQMPVLDGYNATREIRRDHDPNVNEALVIAMTASAIEGDREKCLEAGMNDYLAKPVRSGVLSEMLDQYLAPEPPQFKQRRPPVSRSSSESVTRRDVGIATPVSSASSFASPV